MNIEIIATESLGVRGLCCFIEARHRKILIDPGIALGYTRHGLLPHPFQVAIDEKIQKKIIQRWSEATDIVISHFHGDHVPLAGANPYQLNIKKITGLNPTVRIWAKTSDHLSQIEKKRAGFLAIILNIRLIPAEDRKEGIITFSNPVPHGRKSHNLQTVIMTRVEDDSVFVHASDIQLLNDEAVSQILDWKPDIALVGGPPLYLGNRIAPDLIKKAWYNAQRLSQAVDTLILDHHLMRSYEGLKWLKRLSSKTRNKVICGADFMKRRRLLLEARRERLYQEMPVPAGWHEAYAQGKANTIHYLKTARRIYQLDV
ncbi:MAG: MBL fold metallo-hydrolase [Candidatus Auribacterota bacterium]|nr:MBL fold metallo-hydrolase [Candidatus Auribacterota bacterium]